MSVGACCPVSGAGWPDLMNELDRWGEAERVATLWWRDDDAVAPTIALDRLLSIDGAVPIALAVIPATATPELAEWTRSFNPERMAILQHGWRHLNHSADPKKSEFPADRPVDQIVRELVAGRVRLIQLFGCFALPVLVPPWNRFDDSLLPLLRGCGISAISRAKPRRTERHITGLVEANVHLDLVAWKDGRGFIGEKAALGGLIAHLQARRYSFVCSTEPTGILTHHLVRQEATEAFLHQLFAITKAHRAVCWLDAIKVFSSARLVPA